MFRLKPDINIEVDIGGKKYSSHASATTTFRDDILSEIVNATATIKPIDTVVITIDSTDYTYSSGLTQTGASGATVYFRTDALSISATGTLTDIKLKADNGNKTYFTVSGLSWDVEEGTSIAIKVTISWSTTTSTSPGGTVSGVNAWLVNVTRRLDSSYTTGIWFTTVEFWDSALTAGPVDTDSSPTATQLDADTVRIEGISNPSNDVDIDEIHYISNTGDEIIHDLGAYYTLTGGLNNKARLEITITV